MDRYCFRIVNRALSYQGTRVFSEIIFHVITSLQGFNDKFLNTVLAFVIIIVKMILESRAPSADTELPNVLFEHGPQCPINDHGNRHTFVQITDMFSSIKL